MLYCCEFCFDHTADANVKKAWYPDASMMAPPSGVPNRYQIHASEVAAHAQRRQRHDAAHAKAAVEFGMAWHLDGPLVCVECLHVTSGGAGGQIGGLACYSEWGITTACRMETPTLPIQLAVATLNLFSLSTNASANVGSPTSTWA